MRSLPRIEAVYIKLDKQMENDRATAAPDVAERIEAEQVINDQAYFVLCWGQLEIEIDSICRRAIAARAAHSDWQVRRSWYLYNPSENRLSGLSFESRTALVLDRDNKTEGSPWLKTMRNYQTRNEIAHGKLKMTRVDVSGFVQDCFTIQAALHRSA